MTQKRRAVTKRVPKNRKKRSKGATVLLSVLFTVLLTAVIVCLYLLVFMVSYVNGDSKINLEEYKENQDQTTIIYAYDTNNEVTELSRLHGEQNRVWVTYSENPDESVIPQNLANAYIALEDKRFTITAVSIGSEHYLQRLNTTSSRAVRPLLNSLLKILREKTAKP